jgi:hypothetical protein
MEDRVHTISMAPAGTNSAPPQQGSHSTLQQMSTKDKIKVALAVAITAKKKQVQRDGVDWKKKALAARTVLLALSKTLKSFDSASNDLQGKLMQLLSEFTDAHVQHKQRPQELGTVKQRSADLSAFVDAAQVQSLSERARNFKRTRFQRNAIGSAADCEHDTGPQVRQARAYLGEETAYAALHSSTRLYLHSSRQ